MTTTSDERAGHRSGSPVDLAEPIDRDRARRIGQAWIELRRGANTASLRDYMYGTEGHLDQGRMDALDQLVRGDRTMRGLADRLRVEPSTATRAVDRLVEDGLARRFPSPDDGRVVMVGITAEGRRRRDDVAARRSHAMRQILDEFDADERDHLADLLDRFIAALDQVVKTLD